MTRQTYSSIPLVSQRPGVSIYRTQHIKDMEKEAGAA
jgi:hypothetical protein